MRIRTGNAGEMLTQAYGIMKSSHREPVADISSDLRTKQQVVYDEFKKIHRNAILSTPKQLLSTKQTRPGKLSTNGQVMSFTEAGAILAAAESQSEGHTEWARFCYDPDHNGEWAAAAKAVIEKLFACWAWCNRRRAALDIEKYQDLAMLCCMDSAHRYVTGKPRFSADQVCAHLGYKNKDNANWRRSLRDHWRFMSDILDRHNMQTLQPVRDRLNDLNGRNKERPANLNAALGV